MWIAEFLGAGQTTELKAQNNTICNMVSILPNL
jgi:hypothetical protein